MSEKVKWFFLSLVLIQGFHSIEEYIGELWNIFPPAAFLCGLISDNLEVGFLIINIGLFLFGLICWFYIIRKEFPLAKIIIWFWISIEILNGIVHPIWTIMQKKYTPGIITSPLLLLIAIYLIINLQEKTNVQHHACPP